MSKLALRLLASAALLSGCSLAPKPERPAPPISSSWPTPASIDTHKTADIEWQEFFVAPRLRSLIDLALKNNRDLRIASLRVEQARAQYRIRRSDLFPDLEGHLAGNRQKFSGAITTFGGGSILTTYSIDVGASYEIDLFGRVRSAKRSALESYFATEEARKSAQIALVSQVATEYLTQLRLREAKAIANRTLETVQAAHKLIKTSFDAGGASELDLRTAEGQVQAVKVNSAGFLQLLAESENALVQLVGQPLPHDLPPADPFHQPQVLDDLPVEIPSEVLLRRPDILAAEHALKAANADIGIARAAYFPRILLTGYGGTASAKLTDLFSGPSETWGFSPQITVPLFAGGSARANLNAAKLRKRIEIANYEKAIQNGFREVADALATRTILDDKLKAQNLLLEAQQKRFQLTTARYNQGVDSYLDVLLAQQDLYAAQQNLAQFQAARWLNSLALYRSLGGGWKPNSK